MSAATDQLVAQLTGQRRQVSSTAPLALEIGTVTATGSNYVVCALAGNLFTSVRAGLVGAPPYVGQEVMLLLQGSNATCLGPVRGAPVWHAPSYVNSWADAGTGNAPGRYSRDSDGFVHLEGCVYGGAANTVAFTLPSDYWPLSGGKGFSCWGGDVAVHPNGDVLPQATGPVFLEGIVYYPS